MQSGEYLRRVSEKSIRWSLMPQFPACQTLDLSHYFDMRSNAPVHIFFDLKQTKNLGITLETRPTVLHCQAPYTRL